MLESTIEGKPLSIQQKIDQELAQKRKNKKPQSQQRQARPK